jgi:hypothetical protein
MDTKVSVVGGAVKAEVDAKGDRGPCRVLLAAIEADLVRRLSLQLLEDLERLLLCRKGTHLDLSIGP